ncbi:amino acid adenylation domain-containing protein/non-ribosomal peptide synthase protein (TIGR01720 family) [Catenulispora sp. MAP5-51]|uniref:non-ribosomal peptide synthetase n=1 Tax=Catenulispora sp. MAP5-51 TaxID=3156298 RepID=UPI0035114ECF
MRGQGTDGPVLDALLDAQAARTPHTTALVCGDERLSFSELADRVRRLAFRLRAHGIRPETPVGLCLERGVNMVVGVLAVLRAGGVLVPMDPEHPAERLAFLQADSGAALVLTDPAHAERLARAAAHKPVLLFIDGGAESSGEPPTSPAAAAGPAPLPANAAYLLYTSGSSGVPKGVTVSHASLVNLFLDYRTRLIDPAVRAAGGRRLRVAHTAPLTFDAAWVPLLWLLAGHEMHVVDALTRDDPEALSDLCAGSRLDVLDDTPARLRLLLRAGLLADGRHRPSVITVGGEALDAALAGELADTDAVCHNTYGPTEAAVDALSWRIRAGGPPLIGRPVAGARAYVMDRRMRPVPTGEAGELWLAGPGLARGYHGRPGLTARCFTADPYGPAGSRLYRTGDLVRRTTDGELEFLGRLDDQVKIGGVRVEPRDAAAALERHPGVDRAVVTVGAHADGRPFLTGYVVLLPASQETAAPDAAELRAFLAGTVPRYLVPAALVVLDRLPLLPSGKVDRQALPPARPTSDRAHVSPRTPMEEALAGIWERVLGTGCVGVHDDFLALGGDSIQAMRIVSELRRTWSGAGSAGKLHAWTLFKHPTIAALATALEQLSRPTTATATATQATPATLTTPATPATPTGPSSDGDRVFPLSPAQRRLWFLDQLRPGSTEYNSAAGFRLRGPLEPAALTTALNALAARHEALRTTFATVDGQGVQRIGPPGPVPVEVADVSQVPETDRSAAADRAVRAELGRPFDLERGPLFRVLLVRRAADDHLLVLHQHHIVTDGWSHGILSEELGALYSAACRGRAASLPQPIMRYTDYAAAQPETAPEEPLAYWRRQLSGLSPLELLTDRPRPAVRTSSGTVHRFLIPADLTARLTRTGRAVGATPFMVLAAALQVLLARSTGRRDVALGTVVSGRDRTELEHIVGFFANTVVLRSQVEGDQPFQDFLRAVRSTVLDAFVNSQAPYDRVVEALHPERDASRSPLVHVALVLQNTPRHPLEMAGLTVEDAELPCLTSLFDMTWEFWPQGGALAATVEYDTALFDAATPARLADQLCVLLEGITADPGCAVARLPLLSARDRSRLARWGTGDGSQTPDTTVHELVAEQARRRPDAVALSYRGDHITYAALEARAGEVASRLVARGAGPGRLVGVLLERGADLVVALLAVLKAGAAYVPLDPAYPAERLAFLLADCGADLVLTRSGLRERLPGPGPQALCLDDVDVDAGVGADTASRPASPATPAVRPSAGPRDLAYVLYTSGSTGEPKGVLTEHRSVVRLCRAPQVRPAPGDVVALGSPASFDAATYEIWGALTNGTRLAVQPPGVLSVHELGVFLAAEHVSTLWLTAGLFHQVVDADPGVLAGLRRLIAGGDVLSPSHCAALLRAVPHLELINGYGPTEGTTFTTCHRVVLDASDRSVPIGRPLAATRCHVVDRHLRPVPAGVPGELLIGGDGLARGYLNRPGLTAQRFVAAPGERLYRTGDLVRWLADGTLEFLGRLDSQVKIRGFRVEPGEVEAALTRDPSVAEAVVTARTDGGHRQLVAYVTARAGAPAPTPAALRARLEETVPGHLVPARYVVLERLPLTPHGKVDRRALPAPPRTGGHTFTAPSTMLERTLCEVWSRVLGVERVGADDNFFDLGGDSILSIQVVAAARAAGVRITAEDILLRQTVARLAATARSEPQAPSVAAPEAGPVPLTPIQRWFLDTAEAGHTLFNQWVIADLAEGTSAGPLREAVAAVSRRHGAWRLRFMPDGAGWCQHTIPDGAGEGLIFEHCDLSALEPASQDTAMDVVITRTHSSLRPDTGPLGCAVLFDLGPRRRPRLFATVHHLVVDGVSWRVLLDELDRAYRQGVRGARVDLGPPPASFQDWAYRLRDHTAAGGFDGELDHWTRTAARVSAQVPLDLDLVGTDSTDSADSTDSTDSVACERSVTVRLGAADTAALLWDVPSAYRTQVNDVLLSALARVLARWTGRPEASIALEGHGREQHVLGGGLDLSGVLGWFTTVFPVVLDVPGTDVPGAPHWGPVLKSVKEQLRAVPQRGIGYGALRSFGAAQARERLRGEEPAVGFNYLGRFGADSVPGGLFAQPPDRIGLSQSTDGARLRPLDVTALVTDGELEFTWHYSAARHHEKTVRTLAEELLTALRGIVAHCAAPGSGGATPSDFPLAGLDQAQVDRLAGDGRTVQDIYPLTPVQQGMLFHGLSEPDTGMYLEQVHLELSAVPDPAAFADAWHRTVDQIPQLRTAVVRTDTGRPLHAVHRRAVLPVTHHDWRTLTPADREERLRDLLTADRGVPFVLDCPPLMRVALIRLTDDRIRMVWTFHHLLLDGWSVFQVLTDVLARHTTPGSEPPSRAPFAEYLRRLADQDTDQDTDQATDRTADYWRAQLAGLRAPTPLPFDRPSGQAHRTRATSVVDVRLPAAASARLYDFARGHRVTVNAVVQGMWAVLLWHYGGGSEVCFGTTVSGRPPDLPGVESTIGMFVNTVPLRVRIGPEAELAPWLALLHAGRIEGRQYDHAALTDLRRLSGIPAGTNLFDSILVFENYPLDTPALAALGADLAGLDAVEVTNYPLNAVVGAGEELSLRLVYDPAMFDSATCQALARHLLTLLSAAPGAGRQSLAALPRPPGAAQPSRPVVVLAVSSAPDRESAPYVAPRTATEHTLVRILTEVLRADRIGVHDDFFELGGDSILCVQVTSRIRTELGVVMSPRQVFDHPTAARLAKALPVRPALAADPPTRTAEPPTGTVLSPGQQRLWYLHELAPDSAEYNSALPLRLHGRLDVAALNAALTALTERHEVLRATFDGAVQHVHPPAPVVAEVTDLSASAPEARAAETAELLRTWTTRPFDLRRGPLLRVNLLRLAEGEHILHLGTHHIVCDGWSMAVLRAELTTCYTSAVRGQSPVLSPLPVRYADFAERRRRQDGPAAEARLDYWRHRLAGAAGLDLPTDRPRPPAWNPVGRAERFSISAPLTERLHALASRNETTLFTVLAAAVKLVLARFCAQDDVTVATAVAGRDRTEYEGLVGFFVNTVVLRTQVDEALSFAALLTRVRGTVLEAFEHADTPLEQVVTALGQGGDPGRPALTRVAVVLQNTPRATADPPGLRMEEAEVEATTAQFDLAFEFQEQDGVLTAELRHRVDAFETATVSRIGRHLLAVLDAATARPHTPLHRFPLTGAAEKSRLTVPGLAPAGRGAPDTVTSLFAAAVRRTPHAAAIRAGGQTTTYAELERRADDLALRLTALGVRGGDRVRVVLPPGAEAVTAFVALARIGAAYLSAEPDAPPERLRSVAADSGAVLVLDADTVLPPAPQHTALPMPPSPDHPLACVHTSGSTGRPKGVVLTHAGVVNLLAGYAAAFSPATEAGEGEGERYGQVADLSFDASVGEVWSALCQGACLCVADPALRRDPRALGRWVAEEGLTLCFLPTAVGERMLADRVLSGARRLRHVLLGGERLMRLPTEPVPFNVVNGYGPTEATVFTSWYDTTGWPQAGPPPPIGRPLPKVRAYVLDRWLRPVARGVTGELYIGGPGVAQGYLGAPGQTARSFVADPFAADGGARMYRTGDLVRWSADGLLDYRGRADRQIKSGGVRVELDEIEQLLTAHPAVGEAAVVAVRRHDGHLGIRAYVTAAHRDGEDPPAEGTLREWLGLRLPRAAVPGSVTVMRALPQTPSGKVDRQALAARSDAGGARSHPALRSPRTPTEQAVARAWAALLDPRDFDVREKFFDAGGSSLQLMDLRSRLEPMCGGELPIALLLEHPTIEAMARLVDERRGAGAGDATRHEL